LTISLPFTDITTNLFFYFRTSSTVKKGLRHDDVGVLYYDAQHPTIKDVKAKIDKPVPEHQSFTKNVKSKMAAKRPHNRAAG
jgi:hypothetical protein